MLGSTATVPFFETGLSTNAPYGIVVGAANANGAGSLSLPSALVFTAAAPPTGSAVLSVFATSATIGWGLNQNPPGTVTAVERATDLLFSVITTSLTASTATLSSYTDAGLIGCTQYSFRVKNLNGNGVSTAYDSSLTFTTINTTPTAPSALSAASLPGNKVALSWTASPTEGITYKLFYDAGTGTINYGAPIASLDPSVTAFTTGVLAPGTYKFAVRAAHRCGVTEQNTSSAFAASVQTLSSVRAAISSPQSGNQISGASNALTVAASLTAGSPASASSVRFQFKPSAALVWSDIAPLTPASGPNPATAYPFFVSWDVSGLALGSYDLRAVAYDQSASADTAPSGVTISLAAPAQASLSESAVAGVVTKTALLDGTISSSLSSASSGAGGGPCAVTLNLPPNAFNVASPTVQLICNPAPATVPTMTSGLTAGIVAQVLLPVPGQTLVKPAGIVVNYPDVNDAGVIDGTNLRASLVKMISNTGLAGAPWNQDVATSVDRVSRTITGVTSHFSFFAVAGVPAANLDGVKVFPVPFKPNGANPAEGRPFSASNPKSGIVFVNLPASVTIKIYTVSGTLVASYAGTNGTGAYQWDARTDSGRDAASGWYFAVISSPGFKSVTKRLAVIR